MFNLDCLNHEHIQRILKVLKTFRPDFNIPLRSSNVNSKLLNDIYQQQYSPSVSSIHSVSVRFSLDLEYGDRNPDR
jgi:hypothetical protein